MVAGGLTQIAVPRGEIDNYLTNSPEISFFRTVYKRHTNFSYETVTDIFKSNASFGRQVRCELKTFGDLISNIMLHVKISSLNPDNVIRYGWVNALGHAIIRYILFEIGGRQIDKQYGEWLELWTELTQTYEKRLCYYQMINKVDFNLYTPDSFTGNADLYIPLNFFFCKNYGLALPILSLYRQTVELVVEFRPFEECWVYVDKTIQDIPTKPKMDVKILIDYIYLDIDERLKFLKSSHVYLIEQLQFSGALEASLNSNFQLYFNHAVKELVWVFQRLDVIDKPQNVTLGNDWFNFSTEVVRSNTVIDTFGTATIQINGTDLFTRYDAPYFRLVQPYNHHTRSPANYIYCYSFALRPEELQPTGHLNFSMVDNVRLSVDMVDTNARYFAKIYGINYNVLIITGGMGTTLYI